MPTFSLLDFLDFVLAQMTIHPIYAWVFCGSSLGLSVIWAMRVNVKITHRHEMDDREPEPLRRVVLDATARFPPKAQDRRRVG